MDLPAQICVQQALTMMFACIRLTAVTRILILKFPLVKPEIHTIVFLFATRRCGNHCGSLNRPTENYNSSKEKKLPYSMQMYQNIIFLKRKMFIQKWKP